MNAPAKINVCLFLGPTRADGRHELVSVMQSITLADTVELGPAGAAHDEVVCPGVDASDNLALRAIEAFRAATGWAGPPVRVTIDKRIPIAAGMAGGSADAAATLRLLAGHTALGDPAALHGVAAGLGADVPAQLFPGRALATGAGEVVERLPAPEPSYGVLVLPSARGLSTASVFREADRLGLPRDAASLQERLTAVREALPDLPSTVAVNELEPAARSLRPDIDEALAVAREAGARHALLSGSGPTVLGLFAAPEAARRAAERLAAAGHRPAPFAARTLGEQ
jgi:4-diphosphocytidyl-2-C-methyl-D-erythritol kinase